MTSYSPLDVSEHPREKRRVHWSEQLESVEEFKELELTGFGGANDDDDDDDDEVVVDLHKAGSSSSSSSSSNSSKEIDEIDLDENSPLVERIRAISKLAAPVITSFFLSLGMASKTMPHAFEIISVSSHLVLFQFLSPLCAV